MNHTLQVPIVPIVISEYTRPDDGFYSSRRKVFKRGGNFHVTILPAIPTKGYVRMYVSAYN